MITHRIARTNKATVNRQGQLHQPGFLVFFQVLMDGGALDHPPASPKNMIRGKETANLQRENVVTTCNYYRYQHSTV